ncbi:MAG TPA: purine-nucleoside phosphorylase [Acholeplasmataceae bacterium]|jgi:purine-nucleoside phosphorylase|nr:purine-nucleoside phosphorylase [Acholeplasmataceae bacterium]HRX44698.1 purine-nucleoside phosphorylase [Acholeplasmataceae bacterium]
MKDMKMYQKAASAILAKTKINPKIGLILGSGLGVLADEMEDAVRIPFESIPYFMKPTAEGHQGELVVGKLQGIEVVILNGRYHYYEGYTLQQVTFPVRVMKLLGVETLILTNACGAVNRNFKPGELMVIKDHINLTANNPLIGSNVDFFGPRFPDASEIYTKSLRDVAKKVAEKNNIKLNEGVYTWWTGPSYETPAEIKMISVLGGDAVGMSTVPEALVASHAGMNVLGISCLTNMASGILPQKLSHQEVLDVAKQVRASFSQLIKDILVDISTSK